MSSLMFSPERLRKKTEAEKVAQEVAGRIRQERENHDLHLERDRLDAGQFRTTVMEGIQTAGVIVGDGIKGYLGDWQKIGTTVGALTLLATGVYTAKVSTATAGRIIEARIGKPNLVRETSRTSALEILKHPFKAVSRLMGKKGDALEGVVLEPKLKSRLEGLALSTYNTKKNGAPYRHTLLYGHPGTGKTMFAKNLAKASNMDYAILTGGDVAPLGREAVSEMHKLFDWANTSSKGLLLFVDEADAFLRKRSGENISEDMRNALNAFLYRTGEASDKFMVVFASNQPEQLDWAVNDRTDEVVNFTLPAVQEREDMLRQYFDMYIANVKPKGMFGGARKIEVEGLDADTYFKETAARIEGFSGREISKLAIAWQAAAYGSATSTLTADMMHEIVDSRLEQHMQKQDWLMDK